MWKKKKTEEIVLNTDELHSKVYERVLERRIREIVEPHISELRLPEEKDSPSLCMKVVSMDLKPL